MKNPTNYRARLLELVPKLEGSTLQSRLVMAYVSLRCAQALGYKRDDFRRQRAVDRTEVLKNLMSDHDWPIGKTAPEAESDNMDLEAAYYFNNALLRIVFLTEIGLKLLFVNHMKVDPPDRDYVWLSRWYEGTFRKSLAWLSRARTEVNRFKHGRASGNKEERKFETMENGVNAFDELLLLMKAVADARRGSKCRGSHP